MWRTSEEADPGFLRMRVCARDNYARHDQVFDKLQKTTFASFPWSSAKQMSM